MAEAPAGKSDAIYQTLYQQWHRVLHVCHTAHTNEGTQPSTRPLLVGLDWEKSGTCKS